MKQVTLLEQQEAVGLDTGQLRALHARLGQSGAEDLVCRALEDIALRLSHAGHCYREARPGELRKTAQGIGAAAEQIGLHLLARVAADVAACIGTGDRTALGATLARLLRVGERSLCEAWELQDLSI